MTVDGSAADGAGSDAEGASEVCCRFGVDGTDAETEDGGEDGGWKKVNSVTLARPSRMLVCCLALREVAEESDWAVCAYDEGGGLLTTSAERRCDCDPAVTEVNSRSW